MTITLPGPERQKLLKLWIAGCKRAERRIIYGQRLCWNAGPDLSRYPVQALMIKHIAAVYLRQGAVAYTTAYMALQVKRSKLQAELEGLPWHL